MHMRNRWWEGEELVTKCTKREKEGICACICKKRDVLSRDYQVLL